MHLRVESIYCRLVAEELLKPAKEIKKKAVKRDESDDEDSLVSSFIYPHRS